MGAHQQGPKQRGNQVGHDVFNWMSVEADDTNRSGPLVMLLVDVPVQSGMVEQPGQMRETPVKHHQINRAKTKQHCQQ